MPLSRAAAASSAVPVVLSPVTLNNYGGTCNTAVARLGEAVHRHRRTRRARRRGRSARSSRWRPTATASAGPTSISSTAACRTTWACAACSMRWKCCEALHDAGVPTPLDQVRRIVVFIVNSLSSPPTNWDAVGDRRRAPWTILLKSAGVPIDRYSYEAVELLRDMAARWQTLRLDPELGRDGGQQGSRGRRRACASRTPRSTPSTSRFPALKDKAEFDYLNSSRRRSCCPPRPSIGCARRRERSSWRRPNSSAC